MGFSADICERMVKERTGKSNGKNGYLDGLKANGNGKNGGKDKTMKTPPREVRKNPEGPKRSDKKIKPATGLEKAALKRYLVEEKGKEKEQKEKPRKKKKGISLDDFFGG